MAKNMFLMMKDIPVMRINTDEGVYEALSEKHTPFELKGMFRPQPELGDDLKHYLTQMRIVDGRNRDRLINFLSRRVLPITRENAKKIYQLFRLEQLQDEVSKARIAILCRAVSLQDNYWLKLEGDPSAWADVNLRSNSLSDVVAQVSLHGSSLSLTGLPHTPELTGQGSYAKAWKRELDGLYLHKLGTNGGTWESKIEAMCSDLLDCCNVDHLHYEMGASTDIQTGEVLETVKCKCMTTEDVSILPGMDFTSWCNHRDVDPLQEAIRIDANGMYKMMIVDYLISNRDRHGLNWGFFYDCDTMEIKGCHPLYDHNNAFDLAYMRDKDAVYQLTGESIRKAAKMAMSNVDFHFTAPIEREMFLTERQYASFMGKAEELGIEIVRENALDLD